MLPPHRAYPLSTMPANSENNTPENAVSLQDNLGFEANINAITMEKRMAARSERCCE